MLRQFADNQYRKVLELLFQLFDFDLSEKDMEDLRAMNKNESLNKREEVFAHLKTRMDKPNY